LLTEKDNRLDLPAAPLWWRGPGRKFIVQVPDITWIERFAWPAALTGLLSAYHG